MTYSPPPGVPQTATKANVGSIAVALTTIVLYVLARWLGVVEMPNASLVQDAVVALVGAAINAGLAWWTVYSTRNSRTLPVILVLVLAGAFFLSGCSGALDKPVVKDPVAYQQHVAAAQTFVEAAIVIADRCVAQKIAFCVARADEIETAKTVALGALAEAKAVGTDQTLGQTLLRVAMNAVLLFYSFK